jgi:hypothetical protein
MIVTLRVVFGLLLAIVLVVMVATSLESNLFVEFPELMRIPWMQATIWDFYAVMAPLLLWMWYLERTALRRTLWTLAFVFLGSIGTSAYILFRLFSVDEKAGLKELFLRKEGA